MKNIAIVIVCTGAVVIGSGSSAAAGFITSAESVSIGSMVSGVGNVITNYDSVTENYDLVVETYNPDNMINQSGLLNTYTSGVDDFDDFLSAGVTHYFGDHDVTDDLTDYTSTAVEWFSEKYEIDEDEIEVDSNGNYYYSSSDVLGTITFDLGTALGVEGFALWNEDNYGIREFTVSSSIDGVDFTEVLTLAGETSFFADDNTIDTDYTASVFDFQSTTLAQYIQIDISSVWLASLDGVGLPWYYISVGEVAFNVEPVPEPSTALLFGAGLAGLAGFARRKMDK